MCIFFGVYIYTRVAALFLKQSRPLVIYVWLYIFLPFLGFGLVI